MAQTRADAGVTHKRIEALDGYTIKCDRGQKFSNFTWTDLWEEVTCPDCHAADKVDGPQPGSWPYEADRIYREEVAHVAQRLRRVADDVERAGLDYGTHSRVYAVGRVQHAFMWGLANSSIDRLPRMAEDADTAAREHRDA